MRERFDAARLAKRRGACSTCAIATLRHSGSVRLIRHSGPCPIEETPPSRVASWLERYPNASYGQVIAYCETWQECEQCPDEDGAEFARLWCWLKRRGELKYYSGSVQGNLPYRG